MGLNETMARLREDRPKPVKRYSPAHISPDIWTLFRRVWTVQKTLKCSRCQLAIDGECKRGDSRKAAKAQSLPCFHPNERLLQETSDLISEILKPL